jgi:hypothetical protein
MPKTLFEFEGALRGPNWPEAATAASDGSWSMTFKADGKVLHVHVEVPGTASVVEGQPVAEIAISSLMEALVTSGAVASNIAHLERPSCVASAFVDDAQPGQMTATATARLSMTAELTAGIADWIVRDIATAAASVSLAALCAEFAEALRARDHLVRFVRVYDHLSKIAGNGRTDLKQKQIDAFIQQKEPGVARSKGGPRGPETVYTRLRNEIGHPAERKRDVGELATEVAQEIGNLQKLVASLL